MRLNLIDVLVAEEDKLKAKHGKDYKDPWEREREENVRLFKIHEREFATVAGGGQ